MRLRPLLRRAMRGSRRHARPVRPFIHSPDWMRLPLSGYPDFATWQPFLDEIITHPAPDAFRAAHNFRRTIEIPGFHVTTWFDIFQTSVLAAFNDIQSRIGNQKLCLLIEEVRFAADSPLEEGGFEPSVPPLGHGVSLRPS